MYGPRAALTEVRRPTFVVVETTPSRPRLDRSVTMKIRNSLKSIRGRHRDNQLVRRKGRVYIINKTQKRYKARQG